jgi:hypothetical protein
MGWRFLHGSACNASTALVASADVMALGLPSHRSFSSVGGNIGLALPTNLLLLDGLRRGEGILFLLYELVLWETIVMARVILLFDFPF